MALAPARMLIAVLPAASRSPDPGDRADHVVADARGVPPPPALERLATHEPDGPLGVDVVGVGEDTEDAGLGDDSVVVETLEATSRHRA